MGVVKYYYTDIFTAIYTEQCLSLNINALTPEVTVMSGLTHCGTVEIITDRLCLKRITPTDALQMYNNFACDDRVSRYMSWESFKTAKDVEKWLFEWQEEYKKDDTYYWGVYLKATNELIGTVYLLTEGSIAKIASISYCLGYNYWGNGYICEAVRAIIDFGFNKVGYNRIEAYHAKSNVQSARVLQKSGMQMEGTLRQRCKTHNGYEDCVYYSILKEEYDDNRI